MENNNINQNEQILDNAIEENESKNCCAELKQTKDRYAYLTAEFDNYKKRTEKERIEWIKSAQSNVLLDVLAIVDNFERALNEIQKDSLAPEVKSHFLGFEMISKEFDKFLKKYELEQVDYSSFDPEAHEAIMQVEKDAVKSGDIIDIFEKGYKRKGQIIRPAKVSVAK